MAFSTLLGESAGTITGGQRAFSAIGSARLKPQVIEKLIYTNANTAPVTALIEKLGKKKTVGQPTFYHFETDRLPRVVEVDGNQNDSETSIEVTAGHGKRCVVGTILLNTRTDEMLRVTSISTDTLTVATRPFAGTTAAAMLDNDELAILGTAAADGATSVASITSEPTQVTNACQIFRRAFEMTGRDISADTFTDDEKVRIMRDAHDAVQMDMEQAYLFSTGIATSDPTATAGFVKWATTNVTNMGGVALDEQSWNTFLKSVLIRNYGSRKNMVLFAGDNVCEALDSFARDVIRYKSDDEMLGIAIGEARSSFGTVKVVRHGLLSDTLGSQAGLGRWGGRAFLINFDYFGKAVYKNRGLNLYSNIETPGTDGKKWEYLGDEGLWMAAEEVHGHLKGCAAL